MQHARPAVGAAAVVTFLALGATAQASASRAPHPDPTMSAVVSPDGTLVRGHDALSAARLDVGSYELRFAQPVDQCAVNAGPGSPGAGDPYDTVAPLEVRVRLGRGAGVVRVQTTSPFDGSAADGPVHVQVACGIADSWAVVQADGRIDRAGSGVVAATRTGTGTYTVRFAAPAAACAVLVTVGSSDRGGVKPGEAFVTDGPDSRTVGVVIQQRRRGTGTFAAADRPFHVRRVCDRTSLWALVAPDATLLAGTASAADRSSPLLGTPYRVRFDRDVAGCAFVATPRLSSPFAGTGPVTTALDPDSSSSVLAATHEDAGPFSDGELGLVVVC
jgi:hypothetical protein